MTDSNWASGPPELGLTAPEVGNWFFLSPAAAPLRQLLRSRGVTSADLRAVFGL